MIRSSDCGRKIYRYTGDELMYSGVLRHFKKHFPSQPLLYLGWRPDPIWFVMGEPEQFVFPAFVEGCNVGGLATESVTTIAASKKCHLKQMGISKTISVRTRKKSPAAAYVITGFQVLAEDLSSLYRDSYFGEGGESDNSVVACNHLTRVMQENPDRVLSLLPACHGDSLVHDGYQFFCRSTCTKKDEYCLDAGCSTCGVCPIVEELVV